MTEMKNTAPAIELPTVDIAQLTELFGEPADQQSAVAEWTGESEIYERWSHEPNPRWTKAEAAELLRIWNLDTARIKASA